MEFYLAYVLASIDLAHEYVKLSKTKRATSIFNQTLNSVKTGQISDEAVALFYLRFAESLAIAEDVARRYLACFSLQSITLIVPLKFERILRSGRTVRQIRLGGQGIT
jgi:propanediol dehydratase small subunit